MSTLIRVNQLDDNDLDIFDDSDWDFFACEDEFDMFGEYQDDFLTKEFTKKDKIISCFEVGVLGIFALGVSVYLYSMWSSSRSDYSADSVVVDASSIEYVTGEELSSEDQIIVSRAVSDYFGVYTCNLGLSKLNEYCDGTSKVFACEESYRSKSSYNYDTNDCYSKAIKSFSKYISLVRVNKMVENNGVVYAYCSVNVPDTSQFYDYYQSFAVDLSYHFKSNSLTLINITKYMLKLVNENKVPTRTIEVELQLVDKGNQYVIVSDEVLKDYCIEPYITSISLISDILGGKVFTQ